MSSLKYSDKQKIFTHILLMKQNNEIARKAKSKNISNNPKLQKLR